ncbi:MAG: AMP-binding protein, partial [Flavipsychrobacter sp.]
MISRLFDIVEKRYREEPEAVMLAGKENGQYRTYSCRDVWETAQKLCGGLLSLGIANQDPSPEKLEKLALIAPNRPEWIITDVAVQLTGAVLTP